MTGADEHSTAEDGARVNRDGYDYVANQLRDQGRIEALLRKPGSEWTQTDVNEYANLVTLYPMMRMGLVGGPIGQLGMATTPDNGQTFISYRSAGGAGKDTLPTTATVEVNYKSSGNAINNGERVKLKFPLTGTGRGP